MFERILVPFSCEPFTGSIHSSPIRCVYGSHLLNNEYGYERGLQFQSIEYGGRIQTDSNNSTCKFLLGFDFKA